MAQVFELTCLKSVYAHSRSPGTPDRVDQVGPWTFLPAQATTELDKVMSPYGQSAGAWFFRYDKTMLQLNRPFPWAIIVYGHEYKLVQHLERVREGTNDFLYSWFSAGSRPEPPERRRVAVISVFEKANLQQLAPRSELLRSPWEHLRAARADSHWLCIADDLPEDWLAEHIDRVLPS
jgi:hypothetical protein